MFLTIKNRYGSVYSFRHRMSCSNRSYLSSGDPRGLGDFDGMFLQVSEPDRTMCLLPVQHVLLHLDLESRLSVLDQEVLTQSLRGVGRSCSVFRALYCSSLSRSRDKSGIAGFRESRIIGMFVLNFLHIISSDRLNPHLRGVDL